MLNELKPQHGNVNHDEIQGCNGQRNGAACASVRVQFADLHAKGRKNWHERHAQFEACTGESVVLESHKCLHSVVFEHKTEKLGRSSYGT